MSGAQMKVNREEVTRTISNIVEIVTVISVSATNFRQEVEQEFDRSDAGFLKRVSKSMAQVETASKQIKNTFVDIQDAVESYLREFESYADDTTGF